MAGVYDSDPQDNPEAQLQDHLTYNQVIDDRLRIMDVSAIDVCQQHNVPIVVFNLFEPGTMKRVVQGEKLGTIIDAS